MVLSNLKGKHRWSIDSPHKGPLMWTWFACYDVILNTKTLLAAPGEENVNFSRQRSSWKRLMQFMSSLGPVSLTFFFARNSNSMETSPCHNSVAGHHIATNFCTCHDSTTVVPCTKFCNDHCIRIELRVNRNFHRIWIAMENPLVKRWPHRWGQRGFWEYFFFAKPYVIDW